MTYAVTKTDTTLRARQSKIEIASPSYLPISSLFLLTRVLEGCQNPTGATTTITSPNTAPSGSNWKWTVFLFNLSSLVLSLPHLNHELTFHWYRRLAGKPGKDDSLGMRNVQFRFPSVAQKPRVWNGRAARAETFCFVLINYANFWRPRCYRLRHFARFPITMLLMAKCF